jgi:hypothetical protein
MNESIVKHKHGGKLSNLIGTTNQTTINGI